MSSATPCSGWQVVKHWRNAVPRYSMPSRIALYSFGALAIEIWAMNGDPWPARNVAAKHRGRVRILAAGVRVDLRVEHQRLHVRAVLENDLRGVLIPDVAHPPV